MKTILFADDEIKYRRLVTMFLEKYGYKVIAVEDGEEAINVFYRRPDIDMVILDLMMPYIDGIEACKTIREFSDLPIIMLTALGSVHDEVKGLNVGADDYIAKPFSNEKLIARVNALFRRVEQTEIQSISGDGLTFNETTLTVSFDEIDIQLTLKEFNLLKLMVVHKNQVLSRLQLLDKVWGYDYEGDPRTLDTHIKSLRSKCDIFSDRIQTVRGKGYYYKGA